VVVRVHRQHSAAGIGRAQDPREPAARREPEGVAKGRAIAPCGAAVTGDVLEQCSTHEHVDDLEATADAEDRKLG